MTLHPEHQGHPSLSRTEFKTFLAHTGIEMSPPEFAKLWRKFDVSGDGRLDYTEVQAQFGRIISPPMEGLRMARPETPIPERLQKVIFAALSKKSPADIDAAFTAATGDGGTGVIDHQAFTTALRKLGLPVQEKDAPSLLAKYKEPGSAPDTVTLGEFQAAVGHFARKAGKTGISPDEAAALTVIDELHGILGIDEGAGAALYELLSAYDPAGRSEISLSELGHALSTLGINPSPATLGVLFAKYDEEGVGAFAYPLFASDLSAGAFIPPSKMAGEEGGEAQWRGIPALEAAGLRPDGNPITRAPYEIKALITKVSPRLGLSDVETRMIFYCVGRRAALLAAFKEQEDGTEPGTVTIDGLRAALTHMDVDPGEELMAQISNRYRTPTSRFPYLTFISRFTPLITVSEGMLKKLMLERDPAATAAALSKSGAAATYSTAAKAAPPGSNLPYNPAATQPSPAQEEAADVGELGISGLSVSGTRGGVEEGGASRVGRRGMSYAASDMSDTASVATAALDLAPIGAKLRRVLGSSWSAVMGEALKSSVKKGGEGALVSGTILRDTLAAKGVALTSKELRALSLRYHGSGPAVTRSEEGVVDVEALMAATFVKAGARQHTSPRAVKPSPAKMALSALSPGVTGGIF